jgi:hypothetical protein
MMPRLLLLLFMIITVSPTWAQNEESEISPKWFAGLQYGRQDYQLFIPGEPEIGRTNTRRPQLTLGYQFTQRLALQVGVAPVGNKFSYSSYGTNMAGQPVSEEGWSKGRSVAVPITARYTLATALWKNLHADVLAGGVFFYTNSQTNFRRVENGVITTDYQKTNKFSQFYATLGPSVRYEFGQHIGIFADWLFYKNLQSASAGNQVVSTGNRRGITNSWMLGIRCRFGKR